MSVTTGEQATVQIMAGSGGVKGATLNRREVVWRGATFYGSAKPFYAESEWRSANCCRLHQGRNLFEDPVHAEVGVDGSVDFVMVGTGVHHQDLGSLVRLLDHIGQVMAILFGYGDAKDDEVEGIALEGILNAHDRWQ